MGPSRIFPRVFRKRRTGARADCPCERATRHSERMMRVERAGSWHRYRTHGTSIRPPPRPTLTHNVSVTDTGWQPTGSQRAFLFISQEIVRGLHPDYYLPLSPSGAQSITGASIGCVRSESKRSEAGRESSWDCTVHITSKEKLSWEG